MAGVPCVALSPRPGCAPPMLSSTRRIARPIEAFAGKAGPKQPLPEWMPSSLAIGPLTTSVSATGCVVAFSPATVVRLLEDRLHRREHDREDARLAAGHRRVGGHALDGHEPVTGRQHAEHVEGVTVAALDQFLYQRRRGRDDRQAVGPTSGDHRLVQRARLRGQREPLGRLAAGGQDGGRGALVGCAVAVGRRQQALDLGQGGRGEAVDGRGRDAAERVRHSDIR